MTVDTDIIVLGIGLLTPVYAYLHKLTIQQEKNQENITHILNIIDGCGTCKKSVVDALQAEITNV